MAAQRRRLSAAEEKPFGGSVARILESQRAAQAICNPQCEQIEDHFKYSHSHVIAREMEAVLSSCFSAILPSTGQPGSLNNERRYKPPSERTNVFWVLSTFSVCYNCSSCSKSRCESRRGDILIVNDWQHLVMFKFKAKFEFLLL